MPYFCQPVFIRPFLLLSLLSSASLAEAATATIAAGRNHTLLLKTDGSLWAWGRNDQGQLGDGSTIDHNTPVLIATRIARIAVAGNSNYAIKADGSGALLAWGSNTLGQLGDGSTSSRSTPTLIGTGYDRVVSDGVSTFAFKMDGTRWAWGSNGYGQLEDGTTTDRLSPVPSSHLYIDVSGGTCYSVALRNDGSVWSWGCSATSIGGTAVHLLVGQRGNGSEVVTNGPYLISVPSPTPARMQVNGRFSAVSAYGAHGVVGYNTPTSGYNSIALATDGTVYATGQGIPLNLDAYAMKPVANNIAQISQGYQFILMLGKDQRLTSVGFDDQGQLGTGQADDVIGSFVNEQVSGCRDNYQVFFPFFTCRLTPEVIAEHISAASAGSVHGAALTTDGRVLTWGSNSYGQLGNGSGDGFSSMPVTLPLNVGSAVAGPRLQTTLANISATNLALLDKAPLFEASYYLLRNRDVAAAQGNDAAAHNHWLQYGASERRETSALFDVQWYLEHNIDLVNAFAGDGAAASLHFAQFGIAEGRDASPAFSPAEYRTRNPDLAAQFGNDSASYYAHYVQSGIRACRVASAWFDPRYYLDANPDVAKAVQGDCAAALVHWLNNGRQEGRPAARGVAPLYAR